MNSYYIEITAVMGQVHCNINTWKGNTPLEAYRTYYKRCINKWAKKSELPTVIPNNITIKQTKSC